MLSAMFDVNQGLSIGSMLVLMLCAAACGLLIAITAMLTGQCSRGFAASLVTLPVVVPFSQPLLLRVTIPEDLDYTGVFDDLFAAHTRRWRLEGVKTTGMGSLFELRYTVVLKDPKQEKAFLDELRCRNGNLTLSLTRNAPVHEEL